MSKTFYKVVSHGLTPDAFVSACGMGLLYKVGMWTRPQIKGSKLFVFREESAARYFKSGNCIYGKVCECEVINPVKVFQVCLLLKKICDFWQAKNNRKSTAAMSSIAPNGSYVCDAVKLTRVLPDRSFYEPR